MRVLVLSPGHPDLREGGAERASYALFQRLKDHPGITQITYVARAERAMIGHQAATGCFRGRQDEILIDLPRIDDFTLLSMHLDALRELVHELVAAHRPDVVHIHHVLWWGIEVIEIFAEAGIRTIFTAHEFWLVCANVGQMVKTNGDLCYAASPAECHACFPKLAPGKHFIRAEILKRVMARADAVTSPSTFLAERLAEWGIPRARIAVIDNVLRPIAAKPAAASESRDRGSRIVVGYFGRLSPFKGVDLLLKACALLPEETRHRLTIRVHGEFGAHAGTPFARRLDALFSRVPSVQRMGEYRNDDALALMRACDWIIVPSIWWENSPVVIQEAKRAGRALLAADIGAVAEKAGLGQNILFPPRSAAAIAAALERIAEREVPRPVPSDERDQAALVDGYLRIYAGSPSP